MTGKLSRLLCYCGRRLWTIRWTLAGIAGESGTGSADLTAYVCGRCDGREGGEW
jgi:hypothetical protein